ncbi:MAG TPA: response regulator transcription factor [Rhizomicrobium sp.]|nr:response regulator transcription factor [Rhizomicrobium sp.]
MRLIVVTPTRLLGEGLAACFSRHREIALGAIVEDLPGLRRALKAVSADIALIDVTQGVDLDEVRAIAWNHPGVALVALGLLEQRQDVIRCGRAGFSGYVPRHASVDELCQALSDAAAGRLTCSAEISAGLLRALFHKEDTAKPREMPEALTRRQGEVLVLIGRGLSNKEIARELSVSLSTVKHHVHHVLEKLQLPRRAQAMRVVRESPWIA